MSEEGLPLARYELLRPLKREHLLCDRMQETSWEIASDEDFGAAWTAEVAEAETSLRRETLHLATGLLLPIWDKLPDDHVQIIRLAASDGSSLLGREIPALCLSELGAKLGLDFKLEIAPQELAGTVLASGKSQPFRGVEEVTLKRSLVNGSHRLEITGFEAARLAWYKAQGCFTEIIRYQTRLFVPTNSAAAVLKRLASLGPQ
jgi:hypothetical protein